ncbi:MAG TPA: TetR/AcrR family transcriptional regulator [Acidimicrobiales bacterium]|nr:TetR/AcrR family transcriptional regulator [Acidimicrobiales bacterium]
MASQPRETAPATTRIDGSLGRTLDGARVHRADVAERLVEAARRLMWEAGGPSFTVTQVVAGAGTSLKSFYRCFAGKDELLVALFADDARRGAAALAVDVDEAGSPDERLRRAVQGLFRFVSLDGRLPYAAALVREHLRLAESHPEQLRAVLHPFVALFEREVAGAQERGAVRSGDTARLARTLFHVVVSHLHALICHQIDDSPTDVAEDLWRFCAAALRP